MPNVVPLSTEQRFQNSAWGTQDLLVLTAVPAAAAANLVGKALINAGALTVAGDYHVLIPLAGMVSKVEVHLTGTLSGTVASTLHTTYFISNVTNPSTYVTKTAGSGTGALSTTVRQSSSISTLAGEQFAYLKITVSAASSVTFTQAEYNGF